VAIKQVISVVVVVFVVVTRSFAPIGCTCGAPYYCTSGILVAADAVDVSIIVIIVIVVVVIIVVVGDGVVIWS
jgi:hypothetical protein